MFPLSGQISETDTLLYNSPGENHVSEPDARLPRPAADAGRRHERGDGACADGPIAPPVPIPGEGCFSEFLATADYVGFTGVNAPLSLRFRFTARDQERAACGNSAPDTTLPARDGRRAVPRHRAEHAAATWMAGSTRNDGLGRRQHGGRRSPTGDVKISLSTDGGHTYPWVLAASTPNDGSEVVACERRHAARPGEGRGGRQRVLRPLERELHASPTR